MDTCDLKQQILTTALTMADTRSWEQLHLHKVAEKLEISLDQIRHYYPQKDDLVEAWFDLADSAVLNIKPESGFLEQNTQERLQQVVMTWFESLSAHKKITGEMLLYKLEFGHVHLQVLGVLRISRTVQWFREAARINTTGFRRIIEETGTTTIYLATFACWLRDDTVNFDKTRSFLKQALLKAQNCGAKVGFS